MIRQRAGRGLPIGYEQRIDIGDFDGQLIVPHRPAPVLVEENGTTVLKTMRFSLIPRWSKDPKPKFATHNARIETVVEKPTWKDAFQKRHCLVPLTDFIEPIYDGEFAGFMVAFREANENWLLAAGIWEQWVDSSTGEIIESFAIITSTPDEFIARTGHDRSPLFLSTEEGKKWLAATNNEPSGLRSALEARKARGITFTAERFRPMKAGWEKRR